LTDARTGGRLAGHRATRLPASLTRASAPDGRQNGPAAPARACRQHTAARRASGEGVGDLVAGLVEHDRVGAGDLEHRDQAVALVLDAAGEGGALGLELAHGRL